MNWSNNFVRINDYLIFNPKWDIYINPSKAQEYQGRGGMEGFLAFNLSSNDYLNSTQVTNTLSQRRGMVVRTHSSLMIYRHYTITGGELVRPSPPSDL